METTLHPILRRRRLIFLAALTLLFYSQRGPLLRAVRRLLRAINRTLHTADTLGLAVSAASSDLHHYIYPPPTAHCPPHQRRPASSRGPRARWDADEEPVPRSVRRMLKVAATPEGLSVLRSVAAGAAQGIVREFVREDGKEKGKGKGGEEASLAVRLLETLQAPGGERLAVAVVGAAVREAVTSTFDRVQAKGESSGGAAGAGKRDGDDRNVVQQVVDISTSPKGRALLAEVVSAITKTAVPLLLERGSSSVGDTKREDASARLLCANGNDGAATAGKAPRLPSVSEKDPPHGRSLLSFLGRNRWQSKPNAMDSSSQPAARDTTSPEEGQEPDGPQLTSTCTQPAQGTTDTAPPPSHAASQILEIAQVADKDLLRDLVKTMASEAVRSYLTTQADLRRVNREEKTRSPRGISRNPSTGSVDSGGGGEGGQPAVGATEEEGQGDSGRQGAWGMAKQVASLMLEPSQDGQSSNPGWLLL